MKKILALAGSNSHISINKALATHTATLLMEQFEVSILDLNEFETHLYSPKREMDAGIPAEIKALAAHIDQCDGVVLSLAEHNGSYSAAFKNVYDWASRIPERKVWNGKKLLLMATSPGGRGGQGVLKAASERFPFDGAEIVATFSLPFFQKHFDTNSGEISEETFAKQLSEAVKIFSQAL